MKKRIALLAAFMLFSLAACGKKEGAESKTPESKTAQGYKDGTYSGEAEVKEVGGTIKLGITARRSPAKPLFRLPRLRWTAQNNEFHAHAG